MPQAGFELGSLGPQAGVLPIEPPLLVPVKKVYLWQEKFLNFENENVDSVKDLREELGQHDQRHQQVEQDTPFQAGFGLRTEKIFDFFLLPIQWGADYRKRPTSRFLVVRQLGD